MRRLVVLMEWSSLRVPAMMIGLAAGVQCAAVVGFHLAISSDGPCPTALLRAMFRISFYLPTLQIVSLALAAKLIEVEYRLKRSWFTSPAIALPPGAWAGSFFEFFYPKKKYEKIFVPTIADMRVEYYQALADGRTHKAKIIRLQGYYFLVKAAGADTWLGRVASALMKFFSGPVL